MIFVITGVAVTTKRFSILLTISLLFCSVSPVCGHDLWLEPDAEGLLLLYGHQHSGHEGAVRIEYSPQTVLRIDCLDSSGRLSPAPWQPVYPVRVAKGTCAGIFAVVSTGYWSKTPYGTKNLPRSEVSQSIESWQSFESVKHLEAWSSSLASPISRDLEIVPMQDPFKLKEGAKLELLVALDGKPIAGAIVSYDGHPRGATGEDGRINIKLRHSAFQMIQASARIPLKSEKADAVIHATALTFRLGGNR